jgi:hypothetical protein
VVVDGNLVTARTWHDYATFVREFMKLVLADRAETRRLGD